MKIDCGTSCCADRNGFGRTSIQFAFFLLLMAVTSSGCRVPNWRGQSPDKTEAAASLKENPETQYVQFHSRLNGLEFAKIEGIGLVVGLNGTGSNPAPSWQKDHLLEELKTRVDIQNPTALINSTDTSIVLVRAMIPPAARKGDPVDLEIILPPNSDTTSLEGGTLLPVRMKPMAYLGRKVREGKVMGLGSGGVVVDSMFEARSDDAGLLRGWIPGGGRVVEDRELALIVGNQSAEVKSVSAMARAINDRFTTVDHTGRVGVANARTDRVITLAVPENYRHNVGRYVEVVQSIAWNEPVDARVNRMELLDRQIDNPELARIAAMRLEAMGRDGQPALRRALLNPDPEIRFHAAQALAWQGETDGVEVLANSAEQQPAFRWNALAALASLDDPAAGAALAQLMRVESAEARYGAFRAMHQRSSDDPLVKGEDLASGVSLHIVPGQSPPMLHLTRTRRPEIVVFNDEQFFAPELMWVQPGLTIRNKGPGSIEVTTYGPDGEEQRMACTNRVSDLIRTLGNAGCSYSTLVKMTLTLRQQKQLESRLVVEALPKLGRTYDRQTAATAAPPNDSTEMAADKPPTEATGRLTGLKSIFARRPADKK